jgi:DNA-directed RNA polymerase subunit alpha
MMRVFLLDCTEKRSAWPIKNGIPNVDQLGLSVRATQCLTRANIVGLDELIKCNDDDLLNVKNFGRVSLEEVRELLENIKTYQIDGDLIVDRVNKQLHFKSSSLH